MSKMKDLVMDIMELYEQGMTIAKIAELLRVEQDMVENVVEEYSNFYD